jgi:DNA invertase Pin-like site-specific DNA recombinase
MHAEMHFKTAAGHTPSVCKRYKDFVKELQIPQITELIEQYGSWKEHVDKISCDRIPKKILKYHQKEEYVCEDLSNDGRILFFNIHNSVYGYYS